jgi:regulator of nucleoside diphosphate kinase
MLKSANDRKGKEGATPERTAKAVKQEETKRSKILITEKDFAALASLLRSGSIFKRDSEFVADLEDELARAVVVDTASIPDDVIAMNSTFQLRNLDSDQLQTFTLVYPQHADISQGKLSILAPVGIAVLGYRVGDVIEWKVPSGNRRFLVESVQTQMDASENKEEAT